MTDTTSPVFRRTQQQRRQESERRLMRAAAELIVAQGYGATTLEQIGTRAGYSRGLVSQKFGSKEGLVHAVVERAHRQMYETLDSDLSRTAGGLEAILRIVDTYVDAFAQANVEADPDTYIVVQAYYVLQTESIGVVPATRDFFIQANQHFRSHLKTRLSAGQKEGEIRRDIDIATTATLIQSALSGVTLLWMVERNDFPTARIRTHLVEMIRRMLLV